jgi:tetratricopeptide (TPR) repeat protein
MPYRGLEHSGPACYRHAAAPASESCARCLHPICDICVGFENTQPHCPPCAQKARRARRWVRAAGLSVGLLASSAFAIAVGWVVARDKPYDYAIHGDEVRLLEAQLDAEPCARPQTLHLVETFLTTGDHRGALKRISGFFEKCGDYPRLLWSAYAAHERLNEHDAAIADATALINREPEDKDFWWWRGVAYEEKGDLDRAVADYRKSLEIEPRLTGVPFNLANVLERQGKLCEARAPILQFLRFHPDVTNRDRIDARLERLAAGGRCPTE